MCNDRPIETVSRKGFTINIWPDYDAENPREWDNLFTMALFNMRNHEGDPKWDDIIPLSIALRAEDQLEAEGEWPTVEDINMRALTIAARENVLIMFPVYAYSHGGTVFSVSDFTRPGYPFNCPWDSGFAGMMIVNRKQVMAEFGWKRITQQRRARLLEIAQGEIETFNAYINGWAYGYTVERHVPDDGDQDIDSCWGFYDLDDCMAEARAVVDHAYEEYLGNLDPHFDRFDICEAYHVLEPAYNVGGWLRERPSNQRRRESIGVQLHRMQFRPAPSLDRDGYDALSENGRAILHTAIERMGLPDWFSTEDDD